MIYESYNIDFYDLILGFVTIYSLYYIFKRKSGIPRCPTIEYPLFGHALAFDFKNFHKQLTEWSKKVENKIFVFNSFGLETVVVSSYEGIKEVLISKHEDFAGRPQTLRNKLATRNSKNVALVDAGEDLLRRKKIFLKNIKSSTTGDFNVETTTIDVLNDYSEKYLENNNVIEFSDFFSNVTFDVIMAIVSILFIINMRTNSSSSFIQLFL